MSGFVLATFFLLIALYGYYSSIKISKLEKEIRKNKLEYECFECKEKFSVNEVKCPKCSFVTLYGKRRAKYWVIFPIIGIWLFVLAKFSKVGIF
jgi:DNA-directed RNA polymerase subunit RPC12/RpoP